ncbi:hypothetical protein K1719_021038 [Acacia pycnantha]|nr:hypothetical protein K1719_021038 [Acacia pycnantha]
MGCVASKLEEEVVVTICKVRKSQSKIAVENKYALAEAHCKYFHSLYAVAAAINLFVACHSSASSAFLITLPLPCLAPSETENVINNPMFLQQTPFEPKHEAITCDSAASLTTISEVISGYRRNSDDNLRVVREEEGIPELEEEGERDDFEQQKVVTLEENEGVVEKVSGNVETVDVVNMATESENQREQRGLAVIDTPEEGRELLEALKDIEDYFVRAYNSRKNVTKMLEANRIPLQSGLEEIKGGS